MSDLRERIAAIEQETLDAIMDDLPDYSQTLTTRGRIRAHLGRVLALVREGQEPVGTGLIDSEHPYYCDMQNYYSTEAFTQFEGWAAFLEAMGESDPDLNYVFRWDWNDDVLDLAIMHQRKGRYWPVVVRGMRPEDEPSVRAFLEKRWLTVLANWEPIGTPRTRPVPGESDPRPMECNACGTGYVELRAGEDCPEGGCDGRVYYVPGESEGERASDTNIAGHKFSGLTLTNEEGEPVLHFCLRDDTVELRAPNGPWYRADQATGQIDKMGAAPSYLTGRDTGDEGPAPEESMSYDEYAEHYEDFSPAPDSGDVQGAEALREALREIVEYTPAEHHAMNASYECHTCAAVIDLARRALAASTAPSGGEKR